VNRQHRDGAGHRAARPRIRPARPTPWRTLGGLSFGLALLISGAAGVQAEPTRPALPRSRVETYDADSLTCRPATIESAYRSQMAPWADQPEEVQQRLRILQAEMTRSTLRRCLGKGLLKPEDVAELERRLGLPPQAPAQAGSASGTRP